MRQYPDIRVGRQETGRKTHTHTYTHTTTHNGTLLEMSAGVSRVKNFLLTGTNFLEKEGWSRYTGKKKTQTVSHI